MIILRRLYSRRASSINLLQKSKKDPGIYKRKKALQESPDDIECTDFDQLESDFMSVHKSHREHLEEMQTWKEKEKYLIVKQKYFKEKFPNFLTWHDKEQMRYLHNSDPEEWSIEKLSEGFPAFPDAIEKIVKSKWTKKDQKKISNHDKNVLQNWNDFKQGKLNNLPKDLKEHLQKFSNRNLNFNNFQKNDNREIIIQDEKNKHTRGEFSEIIASYQRLKDPNAEKQELREENSEYKNSKSRNMTNNNYSNFKPKEDHRLLTFRELQDSVEQQISKGKSISMYDKMLKEASFPKKEDMETIELKQEDISKIVEHKHDRNRDVGFVRKTITDMSYLIYPEKIIIPKEIYKKRCTYKLNDCYYDSDGEFLYRVPGMT